MVVNFFFLNLFEILIFIVFFFNIFLFLKVTKRRDIPLDYSGLNFHSFLAILDSFYIGSLKKTILYSFFYFILGIGIFLFFRFYSLENKIGISKINFAYSYLIFLFFMLFFLMIIFYIYRFFINKLFFKEVLKLYIFLLNFDFFRNFINILIYPYFIKLIKILRILFYRISTNSYNPYIYQKDFDIWYKQQIICDEGSNTIENEIFNKYIFRIMGLVKKSRFLAFLLYKISRVFFVIDFFLCMGPLTYLPFLLFFICLIIDVINKEFYFIYYIIFLNFIYYIIKSAKIFITETYTCLIPVSKFFYKNDINYKEQRALIITGKSLEKNIYYMGLYREFELAKKISNKNILSLIYNKTIFVIDPLDGFSDDTKHTHFSINRMFIRNILLFGLFLLYIYIYFFTHQYTLLTFLFFSYEINIKFLVIISFLVLLVLSLKSFYFKTIEEEKYEKDTVDETRRPFSKPILEKIFWFLFLLNIIIIYFSLLKKQLFFVDSEFLLNLSFLKIHSPFTLQDKIIFSYEYFDYLIKFLDINKNGKDYLRFILREIDLNSLFSASLTIKDIKIYTHLFIENYILNEISIRSFEVFLNFYLDFYSHGISTNPWFLFFKKLLFYGSLISFLTYYNNYFILIKKAYTIKGLNEIVMKVWKIQQYKIPKKAYINIFKEIKILLSKIFDLF